MAITQFSVSPKPPEVALGLRNALPISLALWAALFLIGAALV